MKQVSEFETEWKCYVVINCVIEYERIYKAKTFQRLFVFTQSRLNGMLEALILAT